MPRLHLPRSSYDLSVCDFLYDIVDIVGDRGLRRVYLPFIWASYDFLLWLSSTFVENPHILSGNHTEPVRCP